MIVYLFVSISLLDKFTKSFVWNIPDLNNQKFPCTSLKRMIPGFGVISRVLSLYAFEPSWAAELGQSAVAHAQTSANPAQWVSSLRNSKDRIPDKKTKETGGAHR